MYNYRRNLLVVVLFCFVFVLGMTISCIPQAGKGDGMKTIAEMTPKERATWMFGVYNSQARDYKQMVKRTDLTNDQKQVLREKKKIAQKVWPLINTYRTYVNSGAVPTREVEDEIIGLINDLTALALPQLE